MAFTYSLAKFIPFQNPEACTRVRAITRARITEHPNPDFHIAVIDEPKDFYFAFALDIVERIKQARDSGKPFTAILPVGPVPQFTFAAELINRLRIPLDHVTTFNMDEYADQDGNTAPLDWEGSFQRTMWEIFFSKIDPALRMADRQIHFPTKAAIADYGKRLADLGGADVCYGGIGWCGHIAFWEAHLADEFLMTDGTVDMAAFTNAGPRCVELHPMTIMQNALHSFGGDWSWVPPKANSIGPAEILGAKHRSFWLDGDLGGGVSWQRFIARLAAHGPVNAYVPGSLLQTARTDYTLLGGVADDVEINMS